MGDPYEYLTDANCLKDEIEYFLLMLRKSGLNNLKPMETELGKIKESLETSVKNAKEKLKDINANGRRLGETEPELMFSSSLVIFALILLLIYFIVKRVSKRRRRQSSLPYGYTAADFEPVEPEIDMV